MKIYTVLLAIGITTGLQSMEMDQQNLPDLHELNASLSADIYKRTTDYLHRWDPCCWDIDDILYKSEWATGSIIPAYEAIKKYCDEDNNSVAHLLALQKNPDSLFVCVKEGLISLTKNKYGETPYDIAQTNFLREIEFGMYNDYDPDNRVRCCFYILVNYINSHAQEKINVEACCTRHIMSDKY